MLLGSHLSTSGGLHKAIETADTFAFSALALFVSVPRQWKLPALSPADAATFRERRQNSGVKVVVAHASYLLNLAGEPLVRDKSIAALGGELARCADLGIEYLVFHPGSCPDEALGLDRIIQGLDQAMETVAQRPVTLLVEGTAGQGDSLGWKFEHLARILTGVRQPNRYGICLDTCHLFAAGHDIRTQQGWQNTMADFDKIVGRAHLRAIHCNDSQKALGSRVDRHAHIGEGLIGRDGFASVVNDPLLANIPFILETPKGERETDGKEWDRVNADTLLELVSA